MTAEAAFDAFCGSQVGDTRLCVFGVALQGDRLRGVAEAPFRPLLEGFAGAHGLRLQVGFPEARMRWLAKGRTTVHAVPEDGAEQVTEALYGEEVAAFDAQGDFVRVQLVRDRYVGWVRAAALTGERPAPTHRVGVLRAHAFAEPKVSAPVALELAYGVRLRVEDENEAWLTVRLPTGHASVRRRVLEPLDAPVRDPAAKAIVDFASRFMHTPYLWGGRTAWGLDCSGFVQTVYAAHGVLLPRDADQQRACGEAVSPEEARAGDLLFSPGHVMIASSPRRFIHANAHHMRVTVDAFSTDSTSDADGYGRRMREGLERAVRVRGLVASSEV
jgi:cell wall-associated NlpC family hydrolase